MSDYIPTLEDVIDYCTDGEILIDLVKSPLGGRRVVGTEYRIFVQYITMNSNKKQWVICERDKRLATIPIVNTYHADFVQQFRTNLEASVLAAMLKGVP